MKEQNITWNLTHLFANDTDPKMEQEAQEMRVAYENFAKKWREDESYLTDPKKLKIALDEYEKLAAEYNFDGKNGYYWELRKNQDGANPVVKEHVTKATSLAYELVNLVQFFDLRLSKVTVEQQKIFLNASDLVEYKHYLESAFENSKYLLSEPEEKVLNLKSQPAASKWMALRSEFLAKEERKVLTESGKIEKKTLAEILDLTRSKKQEVRDSAGKQIISIMRKNVVIAEHEFNALLLNKKIDDELRGFARPDSARHISDDIEDSVVDALIAAVTKRYDIPHRLYKLKAALLGKKKLEFYDRLAPYGEITKKYTYQEAQAFVQTTFAEVDKEFGLIFKSFVDKGLIDPFPKKGKRAGAACWYVQKNAPTYLFTNFTGDISSVTTLAHEAGHGINNELCKLKQHALNFGTPLSTAEVASTFFEDFILQKLAGDMDDAMRLSLLIAKLDDDMGSIFRQVSFYNFETDVHRLFREKQFLPHEEIGKLFLKNTIDVMGPYVKMKKGIENGWVYIGHFRNFFYVYSYASGLLISKAMQREIHKDKKFIGKVKEFLSAGLSASPKDIFAKMGIDITDPKFWEAGLQEVEDTLVEAEKLAVKLGLVK